MSEGIQNLASFRSLTPHDIGTYFKYSKVTLFFPLFYFGGGFLFAVHSKTFGFNWISKLIEIKLNQLPTKSLLLRGEL